MILVIKHIGIEGPGIIGEFFQNTNWELATIELGNTDSSLFEERGLSELPKNLSGVEAIIFLGGPMNVYEEDKYVFLREENTFLKKAIEENMPVLGICLGAQLLAKACGAQVRKAEEKEIGWRQVNLTEDGTKDRLFLGLDRCLDVFQWHEDTFDIPKDAIRLATSRHCRNQAFRIGKNAYGLQFHFEVTPEMIESWIEEYNNISDGEAIIIQAYKRKDKFAEIAHRILLNFTRIVENR
jgi:GMP synthase-like glutamine amidotransferase